MRNTMIFSALPLVMVLLSSCAVIDGGAGDPPPSLVDGARAFTFVYKAPFLLDKHYLDVSSTYDGSWQRNVPKGHGKVSTNYGFSCDGEFGVDRPKEFSEAMQKADLAWTDSAQKEAINHQYYVWATGNVYYNGELIYIGSFRNKFYEGETCLPAGVGEFQLQGTKIAGNFWTTLNTRGRSDAVTFTHFMTPGSCKIVNKDKSVYVGPCDAPQRFKLRDDAIVLGRLDFNDLNVLISDKGRLTAPDGKELGASTVGARLACKEKQRDKIAKLQERFDNARRACVNNTYSGNSLCYGGENQGLSMRLADNYVDAENDLKEAQLYDSCNNLDPAHQRDLAEQEVLDNVKKSQERDERARERDAQQREREANTVTYDTPTASPFQGLDEINRVMVDGQRRIALNAASTASPLTTTSNDISTAVSETAKSNTTISDVDEGQVVTHPDFGEDLTEERSKTWCAQHTAEVQQAFAQSKSSHPDQLISMGPCTCKQIANSDFDLKILGSHAQYRCELPVTYREFRVNNHSK